MPDEDAWRGVFWQELNKIVSGDQQGAKHTPWVQLVAATNNAMAGQGKKPPPAACDPTRPRLINDPRRSRDDKAMEPRRRLAALLGLLAAWPSSEGGGGAAPPSAFAADFFLGRPDEARPTGGELGQAPPVARGLVAKAPPRMPGQQQQQLRPRWAAARGGRGGRRGSGAA